MCDTSAPLPLITDETWQIEFKNKCERTNAFLYADKCRVPGHPGWPTSDDLWLEFYAGGLWDTLGKDESKQQITVSDFKQMCDVYALKTNPTSSK